MGFGWEPIGFRSLPSLGQEQASEWGLRVFDGWLRPGGEWVSVRGSQFPSLGVSEPKRPERRGGRGGRAGGPEGGVGGGGV